MRSVSVIIRAVAIPKESDHLPLHPDDFPDRTPGLTSGERAALEAYCAAAAAARPRGRALRALACAPPLRRLTGPLHAVIQVYAAPLCTPARYIPVDRLTVYLAHQMLARDRAYFGWEPEDWREVIQGSPRTGSHLADVPYLLRLMAYLLGGLVYVSVNQYPDTDYAVSVFGPDALAHALDTLHAPVRATGRAPRLHGPLQTVYTLALLVGRTAAVATLDPAVVRLLYDAIGSLEPPEQRSRSSQVRVLLRAVRLLERSLLELGVLAGAVLPAVPPRCQPGIFAPDRIAGIAPAWVHWVRAIHDQVPGWTPAYRRRVAGHLLQAGRWLAQYHPEVTVPSQWDDALAREYVGWTCHEATTYALAAAAEQRRMEGRGRSDRPLAPGGIHDRLGILRQFFATLRRRAFVVNGQPAPPLILSWDPTEALATPPAVRRLLGPRPRAVAEDVWLRLVWAAATLTAESVADAQLLLGKSRAIPWPVSYLKAAALLWVTAARRSDELRRLSVGCVRREWAPATDDAPAEELCYLYVPVHKGGREFWGVIPGYTADAIEAWEQERPPNQPVLPDRRTGQLTAYLFQYKDHPMSKPFFNQYLIPLLAVIAGLSDGKQPFTDEMGRITSHRARATLATYYRDQGLALHEIGAILGHGAPSESVPYYVRENPRRLARLVRRADPLDRLVPALGDQGAPADPAVFYFLVDTADPQGAHPLARGCHHDELHCLACGSIITATQATVLEHRPEELIVRLPLATRPAGGLPPADEAALDDRGRHSGIGTPDTGSARPGPPPSEGAVLRARLADLEAERQAQSAAGRDRRTASMKALLQELDAVERQIAGLEAQEVQA